MPEAAESEDLIKRLHEDGGEVLADAFTQYQDRLWRVVDIRLDPRLRGRVDADDVLQEAYLQAVQLVGRGGMETQALAGVLEKAKAKRVILSDAVIAECEYLIHKSRAGLGNTGIPNQQ